MKENRNGKAEAGSRGMKAGAENRSFSEKEVNNILDRLETMYPDADCELNFSNLFELIIAVVLSAQTTDKSVNRVTPLLFEKYPNAEALSQADIEEVGELIRTIGMYKTKSKNIVNLAKELCEKHGGKVPDNYEELVELPGVGRKTANVVLSVGFGKQRIAVDTHVFRVTNRIGLACEKDPLKTELALMKCLPEHRLSRAHHSFIFLGRYCCDARKPKCSECSISDYCRYFKDNSQDGTKDEK